MNEDLTRRIGDALGWTDEQVHSVSLPSLRELVRPVSPKLAYELTLLIRRYPHGL
jgi:hypothetical protein